MLVLQTTWLLTKDYIGNTDENKTPGELVWFTILIGILIIIWPSLVKGNRKYSWKTGNFIGGKKLNKPLLVSVFVIVCLIISGLGFIPFVELGNDEKGLLKGAQILVDYNGQYFFDNYSEIAWLGAQHPPLPLLIIGYTAKILGSDLFYTSRLMSTIFGIGMAGCTYMIAHKLYNRRVALYALFLLVGIRRFYLSCITGNNDIFIAFFFTLSILLLLQLNKLPSSKKIFPLLGYALLAGLSISLGGISKYTMFLIGSLVPLMLLWPFPNRLPYMDKPSSLRVNLRSGVPLLILVFLSSLPILVSWFLFLYQSDVYQDQVSQIYGYLGTEVDFESGEMEVEKVQYLNGWRIRFILMATIARIPAGIGVYTLPLIGLGIWRWIKENKQGDKRKQWSNRFIFIWIAAVFIPVLITLPVDRYFMPAFPALAIMMAYGLNSTNINPTRIVLLTVILSLSSVIMHF